MPIDIDEYDDIMEDIRRIALEKNSEYGDTGLIEFGDIGLIIRINDKMCRLKTIAISGKTSDESAEDTCKDMINYLVYYIMARHGRLIRTEDKNDKQHV